MFNLKTYYVILSLLVPLIALSAQPSGLSEYEYAKKLISDNCYDCRGALKEKLEEGTSILEAILDENTVTSDQYLLLATAYRDLAFTYYPNESYMQKELLQKEKVVLEKMIQLKNIGVELKIRYSIALSNNERMNYLEKLLPSYPDNAEIHFMLGMSYMYGLDEKSKGIDELQKAYDLEVSEHRKITYERELKGALYLYEESKKHELSKKELNENEKKVAALGVVEESELATEVLEPLVEKKEESIRDPLVKKALSNEDEYLYILIFCILLGGLALFYFFRIKFRR